LQRVAGPRVDGRGSTSWISPARSSNSVRGFSLFGLAGHASVLPELGTRRRPEHQAIARGIPLHGRRSRPQRRLAGYENTVSRTRITSILRCAPAPLSGDQRVFGDGGGWLGSLPLAGIPGRACETLSRPRPHLGTSRPRARRLARGAGIYRISRRGRSVTVIFHQATRGAWAIG
jgi:hypothetical protein